jgi:hypothetical protein
MRDLEKAVEAIVREEEEATVKAQRAEHAKRALDPNDWWGKRPFEENRLAPDAREKLVRGLALALFAAKEGVLERGEMKGCSRQEGGHPYGGRALDGLCCRPKDTHGVYVDMGLSLKFSGHAGLRLSGAPEEVRGSKDSAPQYVKEIVGNSNLDAGVWKRVAALRQADVDGLCARYDALVAELEPAFERTAERYSKKLAKSRERAARPDTVAKRKAEARARGRESLSKLLGNYTCKGILDKWGPEELLTYLRLCQKHGYVLKELMRWSGQNPLGSEVIELEDVTTALEMAKVRDVMDS